MQEPIGQEHSGQEPVKNDSVDRPAIIPTFSPTDPLDGHKLGDWESVYKDPDARRGIRFEATYIACLLFLSPILILLFWLEYPKHWLGLTDQKYAPILKYALAWLGGALGGTLFDLKWLYHSVAKKIWHLDRRLWRLFTPHISGGLAFAIVAMISSGMFRIFDPEAIKSLSLVVSVSFLVGYFSDSAIAKLAELAETLFGTSTGKEKHKEKSVSNPGGEPQIADAAPAHKNDPAAN